MSLTVGKLQKILKGYDSTAPLELWFKANLDDPDAIHELKVLADYEGSGKVFIDLAYLED